MQTSLADFIRQTEAGREADAVLRACVHCGFCNATCPTYQLLGDELDGPRGRIYLMKQVLEGRAPTATTRLHLDRCLTCRNCETTCPSGVRYARLLEIGRAVVEEQAPRGLWDRLVRGLVRRTLLNRRRFVRLLAFGQALRPVLPAPLRRSVPKPAPAAEWPAPRHPRRMLALVGCVQPVLAPNIDAAAARVLDRLGISLIAVEGGGCCGAVSQHTSAPEEALALARRNIDAWWPHLEAGAEAIVVTASGCGVQVKDYGYYLRNDPHYAEKAQRVSAAARDLCEVLAREDLAALRPAANARVAFQSPCSLQHGQRLGGVVEDILRRAGFTLTAVSDAHLCCGSAGTYSVLQPRIARRLRRNKLAALTQEAPDVIATANIGCLTHLQAGTDLPVRHWIELLAD
ncbi:MAG TPA: glycolate oxidase subunit GlcF, partial [Burkholderiales bacterium]